jgi:cytochrome c peroxidase
MHDGRFASLEDVLDHYNEGAQLSSTLSPLIMEADNVVRGTQEPIRLNLNDNEKHAIIAFLHTLTDQEFLTKKSISSPF